MKMKTRNAFAIGGICGFSLGAIAVLYFSDLPTHVVRHELVNAGKTFRALKSLRSGDSASAVVELEESIDWTVTGMQVFKAHEGSSISKSVVKYLRHIAEYREQYPYSGSDSEESSKVKAFLAKFR
jgi:hypothetical protein